MKTTLILPFLFLLCLPILAQVQTPALLASNKTAAPMWNEKKVEFFMPDGFVQVGVKPASQVPYHFASQDPASGFEVRYYIKPYNEANPTSNAQSSTYGPSSYTYNFFLSTVLDASQTQLPEFPAIENLPLEITTKYNNGDYRAVSSFKPEAAFGQGFTNCTAQVIRKEGVGEVYIFWMFTQEGSQEELLKETFANLKFR